MIEKLRKNRKIKKSKWNEEEALLYAQEYLEYLESEKEK